MCSVDVDAVSGTPHLDDPCAKELWELEKFENFLRVNSTFRTLHFYNFKRGLEHVDALKI